MLISKEEFIGLDNLTHLATGGESPMLKSHRDAIDRFLHDKARGVEGRYRMERVLASCKRQVAQLLDVQAEEVAFLSSTSEGVNLVAHALDWQPGDNVVVGDVEFPSDVLPWTRLNSLGVETRVVPSRDWQLRLEDIDAVVDERTRLVAVSLVSYFTGQRLDLDALSQLVRKHDRVGLLVDVTHAAGVIPVQAHKADIMVCSCYKWLLGTHGCAIFYWNQHRLPNLSPPFLGWNSTTTSPTPDAPLTFELRPGADRFLAGNPNFVGLYILENALERLLNIGIDTIETYVLQLSGLVREGLAKAGWEVITPRSASGRAGNVSFLAPDVRKVMDTLASRNVHIFGGYGGVPRLRVSTHLYNDEGDVARLLAALANISPRS